MLVLIYLHKSSNSENRSLDIPAVFMLERIASMLTGLLWEGITTGLAIPGFE